jgi:osmotically inducible protein OsmC
MRRRTVANLNRRAKAIWKGGLRGGDGRITGESGVLVEVAYSFGTRFENEPGTNPEELLAAAHAACFSMAFSADLEAAGYEPDSVETQATCTVSSLPEGGWRIAKMRLVSLGRVAGIDEESFQRIAQGAKEGCPVSNALRAIPVITLEATLV